MKELNPTRMAPGLGRRWGVATTLASSLAIVLIAGRAPHLMAQGACSDTTVCSLGVFCSGFEEGNKAIWDDWDSNPDSTNLLMVDPGPCNRPNNHIMRLRVPAGRGNADLVKVLPGTYDKLYARWYEKWEPGYDFSALNHGGGLHAGSRDLLGHSDFRPDGTNWFSSWIEPMAIPGNVNARPALYTYYRGMYQDCADPNGSCWGDLFPCMSDEGSAYCTNSAHRETVAPPKFVAGQWYCIEMMMDGGTPSSTATGASGQLNFWIDDVQYGPWTNLWFRSTSNLKLDILWLNIFYHGNHSVEGVMLDDAVVSTQRIGCHSAAASLSPPTNLRIVR